MDRAATAMPSPILIYLVTEDWYFVSHRLPMARAARNAGFDVHVATRVAAHGETIVDEGFTLHPLVWQRGSTNPRSFLRSIAAVRRLYRNLRPAIAHHVGLQPSIVGSLAALGRPIATLNALAGMGYAFTSRTARAQVTKGVLSVLIRLLFRRPQSTVLVQNPDDQAALAAHGVPQDRIALIPGSGVDTDRLLPLPEPDGPITAAYVGRLLADKGLYALIDAHRRLSEGAVTARLLLAGTPDPANPASIPEDVIAAWRQLPGVELLGHVNDIRTVWARAQIAVLPSRREGLPLSLLEAAACGRPLIATDVPGCREIARNGVNATLVPVDDSTALAAALADMIEDNEKRKRYGAAGRALVEAEFSARRIGTDIVALYRRLLDAATARGA